MCKIIGLLVLLQNLCAFTSSSSSSAQYADIPLASNETVFCDFNSTINISDGSLQIDKSWLHNGLHYGVGYYAKYDYVLDEKENKIPVSEHIRGCICLLRPCIHACCPPSQMTNNFTGDCVPDEFDELWWDVGLEGEDLVRTEVSKTFQWIHRRPSCKDKHFLDPDMYTFDQWFLARVSMMSFLCENLLI